jgi:uncharacterized protein YkwD
MPPLEWSNELWDAAHSHTQDIGSAGLAQHKSSNGDDASERVARFIKTGKLQQVAENLEFGLASHDKGKL